MSTAGCGPTINNQQSEGRRGLNLSLQILGLGLGEKRKVARHRKYPRERQCILHVQVPQVGAPESMSQNWPQAQLGVATTKNKIIKENKNLQHYMYKKHILRLYTASINLHEKDTRIKKKIKCQNTSWSLKSLAKFVYNFKQRTNYIQKEILLLRLLSLHWN